MKLEGAERKDLREILLAAFDRADLKSALGEASPSRELENLVTPGPFKNQVFELIECAERQGWLDQLLVLLEEEAPGRNDLIARARVIFERARERAGRRSSNDEIPIDSAPPDASPNPDESTIDPHVRRLLRDGDLREVTRRCSRITRNGTFVEATAINRRMIELAKSVDSTIEVRGYDNLGDLYEKNGKPREAKRYWTRSLLLYRRHGEGDKVAELERKLARRRSLPKVSDGSAQRDKPPCIFYSYAHEDEALRDQLAKHLKLLERQGAISSWHDRSIGPGIEWDQEINKQLLDADIILLLISADFLASDYIWGNELKVALERHKKAEARVIPIILRSTDWTTAPFSHLQALPQDGRPVTSWANRDEAFANIARALRAIAAELS